MPPTRYDLLVTAIKANQLCKQERQNFSVLRSTPLGKHIEPEIAKEAAISLIDCFHRLYLLFHSASSIPMKSIADVPQSSALRRAATASPRSMLIFSDDPHTKAKPTTQASSMRIKYQVWYLLK
jgi:hypothetical protein